MRRISQEDLSLLSHNFQVRFGLFCAYQVKDKWDKIPECYKAIRVVSLWLEGKASGEECLTAAFAADYKTDCYGSYVVGYVAFAAADAVHAAMNVGYAVAFTYGTAYSTDTIAGDIDRTFSIKITKEQWDFYNELLHFDEIVEKALLGESVKQIRQKELELLTHNFQVRFALFCAYQVKDKWDKIPECVEAVRVTELWLDGKATQKECKVAASAASYAAHAAADAVHAAAAADAVHAAYTSTSAASYAAGAAQAADYNADYNAVYAANATGYSDKVIEEQWDFYNELLHFDKIAEKALLGEDL